MAIMLHCIEYVVVKYDTQNKWHQLLFSPYNLHPKGLVPLGYYDILLLLVALVTFMSFNDMIIIIYIVR